MLSHVGITDEINAIAINRLSQRRSSGRRRGMIL